MPINPNDFPVQNEGGTATLDPSSFPVQSDAAPSLDPSSFPVQSSGGDTPATDSALKQSREAQRPKVDWSHPVMQGVKDVIEGTLQGAVHLPEQMYKVARAGFDKGTLGTATELANQAIPMGAQIAKDVQSPVGSREWTRGVLQMGMMATPGLEIARELRPIGKPPIQPEAFQLPPSPTLGPGTTAADVTKALQGQGWERRFQMVPEPKAQVEPAPDLETVLSGLPEGRFGTETPEGFVPQARTGVVPPSETARIGDQNASTITSAEGVSEPEVRTQVGEEAPLRQQGETAGAQEPEPVSTRQSVATEVQAEPDGGGVGTVEHRVQHGEHAEEGYTAIDTPEEDVGISQAKTEAELGIGSVEPGSAAEMGSGLRFGRNYINKGGDPRLPIRRALASGMVGKNDVGIVHAELDNLRSKRNAAAQALEANPNDPVLQQNLDKADKAQRAWRKELQPVLTKASDTLREVHASSLPEADPTTYQGLADIMDEHFKGEREITPEMRTAMTKAAKGAREVRDSANAEMKNVEQALTKQLKGKKVMTPRELDADLRAELEDQFSDCVVGG